MVAVLYITVPFMGVTEYARRSSEIPANTSSSTGFVKNVLELSSRAIYRNSVGFEVKFASLLKSPDFHKSSHRP